MTVDLIIVRHGRPVRDERIDEPADPGLSDIGREQARLTGEFLRHEGIDHVVASPMARAAETARIIADVLGIAHIEHLESLKEVDHKRNRYIPAEEIDLDDPLVQEFRKNPMMLFDDHGGLEAFMGTVVGGFDRIIDANPDRKVAVVCHGGVMGAYLCHIVGHRNPFALSPAYCALMRVRVRPNGTRFAVSMNESGHVRETL